MFRQDHIEAHIDENGNVPVLLRLEKTRYGTPVTILNIPIKTAEWLINEHYNATPDMNIDKYVIDVKTTDFKATTVYRNIVTSKQRYDDTPNLYRKLHALTELIPDRMPNFRVKERW